jgi:hypothetical protein
MPVTFVHNAGAVPQLRSALQLEIVPEPDGEWLRLRSLRLNNQQLYDMLRAAWPAVVGAEPKKFALFLVRGGAHAGVWFHLLPDDTYEPGCHDVADF